MKLIKWLSVSDRYAKAYLDEKLAPLGLTSSQHMYVLKICRTPGLTQEALLDRLYIHPSNVTRTITLLERSGFLTRQPCDHDRRTYRLYPTEKAQKAVPAIEKACRDTEDALLKALPGEDRAALAPMLQLTGRHMAALCGMQKQEDEFDV
ncbi:MAG: MarR family winged helix-turn-helix transcriptional regulator [Acutalibacteraceae bacterium]